MGQSIIHPNFGDLIEDAIFVAKNRINSNKNSFAKSVHKIFKACNSLQKETLLNKYQRVGDRAILYDASIGRFLQIDPDPGYIKIPLTVNNKYVYTVNSPVDLTDPSGRSFLDKFTNFTLSFGLAGFWSFVISANISDDFDDREVKAINFTAALIATIGTGYSTGVGVFSSGGAVSSGGGIYGALTSIGINSTLALSEDGEFVENFTKESYGTPIAGGLKNWSVFNEVFKSPAIFAPYLIYRYSKNENTVKRRLDRLGF